MAINRYAGVIYGLTQGLVFERDYLDMTVRELSTGVRSNPPEQMKTFRERTFIFRRNSLRNFRVQALNASRVWESSARPGRYPTLNEAWTTSRKRDTLLSLARELERECILSPQLFCAARK